MTRLRTLHNRRKRKPVRRPPAWAMKWQVSDGSVIKIGDSRDFEATRRWLTRRLVEEMRKPLPEWITRFYKERSEECSKNLGKWGPLDPKYERFVEASIFGKPGGVAVGGQVKPGPWT